MKVQKSYRLLALLMVVTLIASCFPCMAMAESEAYAVSLVASSETVESDETFVISVVLNGTANDAAPSAAEVHFDFTNAVCESVEKSGISNLSATYTDDSCIVSYYGYSGNFDENGKLVLAEYTFSGKEPAAEFQATVAKAANTGTLTSGVSEQVSLPSESTKVTITEPELDLTIVVNGDGAVSDYRLIDAGWRKQLHYWTTPGEGSYVSDATYTIGEETGQTRNPVADGSFFVWNDQSQAATLTVTFSKFKATHEIGTAAELEAFRDEVNAGTTYAGEEVKLTADIDMSGVTEWTPIGGLDKTFQGTFDGNGHIISGLKLGAVDSYVGFFGRTENAQILDLTVSGVSQSAAFNMGGIAALAVSTKIDGCSNYIDLDGTAVKTTIIGGIAGDVDLCCITNCRNYGNITGDSDEGGIIGRGGVMSLYNTISQCSNEGRIEGCYAGGICGLGKDMSITECANRGEIYSTSSTNTSAGGILASTFEGKSPVAITSCYNTGAVTGYSSASKRSGEPAVGGIFALADTGGTVNITNCWNSGTLTKLGAYTSKETRYGEIAALKDLSSIGTHGGGEDITVSDVTTVTISDCYTSADSFTAELLNDSHSGVWVQNGDEIRLWWECTSGSQSCKVTFIVLPENVPATVSVYSSEDMDSESEVQPGESGYVLPSGIYYYRITAAGYVPKTGSFKCNDVDITVSKTLNIKADVTFSVTPSDATFVVTDEGGNTVTPSEGVYTLCAGDRYTYTASASGYSSVMREFTAKDGETISVTLTESSYGDTSKGRYIYGSENVGYNSEITEGGVYFIAEEAKGTITVSTDSEVTLVGRGTAENSKYSNIYIDCSGQKSDLTLQDVYISNTSGNANLINFANGSSENRLNIDGVCILDKDTGATGYSMIHVPDSSGLTVSGSTLYLYKRDQGAGIGGNASVGEGQTAETNGSITLDGLTMFGKNSKQGALIGAGASAGTQEPGEITITNSELYLLAISRGAAIGGSAGSSGASKGSHVTVTDSTVTINVDWSGSAIGGGGYDGGNDADGGVLTVNSGSIRTFIDENAISQWKNVSKSGVNNNQAVTASVQNADGTPLYLCVLDTSGMNETTFTVSEGSETIYNGGLHKYAYVNEALEKDEQIGINYTMDNWTTLNDSNLYLYLTGEDHVLDVNGQKVKAVWNAETEDFELKTAESLETIDFGGNYSFIKYEPIEGTTYTYDGKAMYAKDGAFYCVTAKDAEADRSLVAAAESGMSYDDVIKGDINENGAINIMDAQIAYNISANVYSGFEQLTSDQIVKADVNNDLSITAADARTIQYYIHGLTE